MALIEFGGPFVVPEVQRIVAEIVARYAIVHADLALSRVERVSPGIGTLELESPAEPSHNSHLH